MNCSEIKPHLEAFALGALDPYHRTQVELHLQTCAACRHTLASFREVVGELPHALSRVSSLRTPSHLKNKIMQAAQADVQARVIQETFAPHAAPPAPFARRGSWLLNPRVWVFSLVTSTLLIVLLLGISYVSNLQTRQALSREQAALDQLVNLQANQQQAFLLASSQARHEIVLGAPDNASPAYGKVTLEMNKPTVLFTAYNLPPPGLNQRYFLWTVNKGAFQLAGQFTPNEDGFAMVVFMADREDPVLKQVFVTRQPISKLLPSSDRVLVWKADPNDLSENLLSIFPSPTVVRPTK